MVGTKSQPFKRGQMLELVAYALELSSNDGTVFFDAHVPNTKTGKHRQVDIASFREIEGRQALRTFEVRHRGRAVTDEFVDAVLGKAQQVGAETSTIVSASGFTKGALQSISALDGRVEALELRAGKPDELPKNFTELGAVELVYRGKIHRAPIEHRLIIRPIPYSLYALGAAGRLVDRIVCPAIR